MGENAKRFDIQALRGIAVLAVLVHHLNGALLPSGLLGVDVFFVISGYVITRSIASRTGAFRDSLIQFYIRRVKRLLPALVFCVLITGTIPVLLVPNHFESTYTGVAALFAVSNFSLFFSATDYFSGPAEFNAFTHTWSLGVEEQYYLLYPALFFLLYKRGLAPAVALLSVLSAVVFFHADPVFSFYMLPARFWELGAGCLVFLSGARIRSTPVWLFSMALTLLVLFFPLEYLRASTAMAVLATALAIISFDDRQRLSLSVLASVGAISYSLYLWHWPIIVFFRHSFGVDHTTYLPITALALGMACFSYFIIEKPLRYRAWKRPFGYALSGTTVTATFLLLMNLPGGKHVIGNRTYFDSGTGFTISGKDCQMTRGNFEVADCLKPGTGRTVFVIGDSHARNLVPAVHQALPEHDLRYLTDYSLALDIAGVGSCPGKGCDPDKTGMLAEFLRTAAKPGDAVVFSVARDLFYEAKFDGTPRTFDQARVDAFGMNLRRLVAGILESNAHLILVDDIPKLCNAAAFAKSITDRRACSVPRKVSLDDRAPLSEIYAEMAHEFDVGMFDPHPALCSEQVCEAFRGDELMYVDESPHLTLKASLSLSRALDGALNGG